MGAQPAHGLGLADEDLAAAVGQGDLQHGQGTRPAGLGLQVADEEGAAGGAGAESAADLPPAGEHVTGDDLQRVLVGTRPGGLSLGLPVGGRGGGGQRVLDDLQQLQELIDAGEALAGPVGGGRLHQLVHVLRQPVHQGAGAQALARLQAGQQLGLARRRGLAGDQQIGEDAEPVHVEVDGVGAESGELRGEVGVGVLGQVQDGQGGRREPGHALACGGVAAALAGDLPVGDLQLRGEPGGLLPQRPAPAAARTGDDEDGAGGERPVMDTAGVRGAKGLGELAHQRHPAEDVELLAVLDQVLVQFQRVRVVVEDQGGTGGVTGGEVLLELHGARMLEAPEHGGLAPGGVLDGLPERGVGAAFAEVDTDADGLGEVAVTGEVIRPGGTGVEGLPVQLVGADLVLGVAAPHPDLLERRLDLTRADRGDAAALVARRLPQHLDQFVDGVDAVLVVGGQPYAQAAVGEADGLGDPDPLAAGLCEQAGQLLGLPVDQMQRVAVGAAVPTGGGLDPGAVLRGDRAVPVLQLDHAHATGCDDQQVDLTDVAGVGGEGEVRPGSPGVGVRQLLPDRLQAAALVIELGLGDRGPPAIPHVLPRPSNHARTPPETSPIPAASNPAARS